MIVKPGADANHHTVDFIPVIVHPVFLLGRPESDPDDVCAGRIDLLNLRRILPHDPDGKIRPLLSFAGLQRGIADPWYTDDFGTTYDDLVLGCTAFLDALRRRGDIEKE